MRSTRGPCPAASADSVDGVNERLRATVHNRYFSGVHFNQRIIDAQESRAPSTSTVPTLWPNALPIFDDRVTSHTLAHRPGCWLHLAVQYRCGQTRYRGRQPPDAGQINPLAGVQTNAAHLDHIIQCGLPYTHTRSSRQRRCATAVNCSFISARLAGAAIGLSPCPVGLL